MKNNYFFVDGASLLMDLVKEKNKRNLSPDLQLNLAHFSSYFTSRRFERYHSNSSRRFVFYFVQDNEWLRKHVVLPDYTVPNEVDDLRIEFCGKVVKQNKKADDWLKEKGAPQYVLDGFNKSEKAVDTQICCDALQLAATGKLDRLFLYTNDYDFAPLCKALRQLGSNINLMRLSADSVNEALAKECDALNVIDEGSLVQFLQKPLTSAPS
jgi:uncharacterized LabA/DUF88 family protein